MISSTEAGGSAFSSVVNQKSPAAEHEEERDQLSWRTTTSSVPFSRHFWPMWGPYSSAFSSSAIDHALKPPSPPLWSLCSFGGPAYSPLLKERLIRFASCSTDEEKPSQSYIGLIAEAILSSPEEKLILSDIYNYILSHFPYFRNKGTGWRNSIRHNLSLNDCFVKAGRSPNGKGHFWAISSLYYEDFRRGDFRRRRTQKRSHKTRRTSIESAKGEVVICKAESSEQIQKCSGDQDSPLESSTTDNSEDKDEQQSQKTKLATEKPKSFDMASLLAPDREQREGIVFPIIPRPFDAGIVYSSCSPYTREYFSPSPSYDRTQFLHVPEQSRFIFPYNYRLAC